MKLKKVKIRIIPTETIMEEWKEALRGRLQKIQPDNEIIFPSIETMAGVLTPMRLELLAAIIHKKPKSIYALAKAVSRDFKNVHTDVKVLAGIGFIDLVASGKRSAVIPVAKYTGYEIDFAA